MCIVPQNLYYYFVLKFSLDYSVSWWYPIDQHIVCQTVHNIKSFAHKLRTQYYK